MELQTALREGSVQVSYVLKAVWLFFLYLVSVTAVVVAFSAYQLQHNIRTFDAGGQSLAVWRVLQSREAWNSAQSAKAAALTRLASARGEYELRAADAARIDQEESSAYSVLSDAADDLAVGLREQGGTQESIDAARNQCCNFSTLAALYNSLPAEKKTALASVFKAFDEAVDRDRDARNASNKARFLVQQAQQGVDRRTAEVTDSSQAVDKVIESTEPRVRDAMGDFLTQLNYLTAIPGGRFFEFGATASDMLTLILVLAMGALGGTIHLTRIYLDGDDRGTAYYLFRPLLGAITALTVYIVARAGVFVLSDPTSNGARSPLSPFFISFLAIISGLIAEQALVSIQNVGSRWLNSADVPGQRNRWAAHVKEQIDAQKRDIADMEKLLEVEPGKTAAWLEEREPVPPDAQIAFAAWLNMSIRDLFSDMPPERSAPEGG